MKFNSDEIRKAQKERLNGEKRITNNEQNTSLSDLRESVNGVSIDSEIDYLTTHFKELRDKLEEIKMSRVEMVFIFDKSCSCFGTEYETVKGFNEIIKAAKIQKYDDYVTTVLFDETKEIIYDRKPINDVKLFSYVADGLATAIYDAIYSQIKAVERSQRNDNEKLSNTLVVIMTDGIDNASIRFSLSDTKSLIKSKINDGWKFLFLGTMQDAKKLAKSMGIKEENAENYSIQHITDNFKAIQRALDELHETGQISSDWSKPIIDNRKKLSDDQYGKVKKLGNGH
jgi:hypothetical protein